MEIPQTEPTNPRRPWYRRWGCMIPLVFGLIILVCVGGPTLVYVVRGGSAASTPTPHMAATSPVDDMSALEQMEYAFVGNPRQSAIQDRLDTALALYHRPATEQTYRDAGNTLVTLRKRYGPSEMDILDYMICAHQPGTDAAFGAAAETAAVALQMGYRCAP